jgi:regulator of sigma E protease
LSVIAVPRTDAGPDEGALGVLFFEGGEEKKGFFSALWNGLLRSLYVCGAVVAAFFNLIKNLLFQGSLLEGVVGPIGVFAVAYDAGGLGLAYLLQLVAMISLNLTIVNLIPFPALDGGRLLLIVVEKIKGSPLPRKIEAYTNAAGFAFLILLMALLTIRDVGGLL